MDCKWKEPYELEGEFGSHKFNRIQTFRKIPSLLLLSFELYVFTYAEFLQLKISLNVSSYSLVASITVAVSTLSRIVQSILTCSRLVLTACG